MTRRSPAAGCPLQDHPMALAFAAALLLAAIVSAAAPPVPLPEQPAPGPLFDPEEVHTNPLHLSLAVFGATAEPHTGRLTALGTLYAGEKTRAWNLDGAMTNRYSRISVGASTLVLGGFGSFGGAALAELANLQAGHQLDCWALIDTERFRGLPNDWLQAVTDRTAFTVGGLEAEIYSRVLIRANYTSAAAFKKAARRDVTYVHVFNEPQRYRGVVVHVEGQLRRINRYDPPPEAQDAGVNDLYEAWVYNEQFGANPYCILFTEWPAELSRDLLGKQPLEQAVKVAIDGYFFKKFRYTARGGTPRDAPLVVGHGLVVLSQNGTVRSSSSWMINSLVYVFAGVLFALVVGVVGLTYWYRRSDSRVRRRILARMPEFVLPPPDSPPVAGPTVPLARPAGRVERPLALPPRITFPAGMGDRGGEPPGPDEGGKGKKDKPPDEGAGA